MSLYIRFPRLRSSLTKADLVVLGPDEAPGAADPGRVVVAPGDPRIAGRWDDEAHGLTALVSGSIVNVPAPLRGGTGATAARALGEVYAKHGVQAFALVDGAYSFAVLDWRRGAIIVGHDKLGIARAYLARSTDTIAFSDHLALLLRAAPERYEVDLDSI
jgi:hypothetical protein